VNLPTHSLGPSDPRDVLRAIRATRPEPPVERLVAAIDALPNPPLEGA
jgi:hypothetical protein